MQNKIETLGVMIDMSRNAVMSVSGLKRYLPLLKKMGYNCVMLYTEDTYEIEGEPYFGYMRGRYTKSEMKQIDAFAKDLGIEIIPCIQTLAHLNAAIRWGQYPIDCDDILLVDDEKTYELIEKMFKTTSECFESRRIHAGMDEAMMLGRGKHLDKFGYEGSHSIMERHIKKVKAIAEKYGYEIMIWSDMYFRSWQNHDYYLSEKVAVPKEVLDAYDPSVIPVYWDYYHKDYKTYDAMIDAHLQFSKNTWFAGGAWTWSGFAPNNRFSLDTMLPGIKASLDNGLKNIVFTMWGDYGGECSPFAVLPALHYLAEAARGNNDEASIKAKFEELFGISYDDFMMLDAPNTVQGYIIDSRGNPANPSKYMLYSDYFNDYLDYTVELGVGANYKAVTERLSEIAENSEEFGYLFDSLAKLSAVLEYKYELGLKTRNAYKNGDKDELRRLANVDYKIVAERLKDFGDAYEKRWFYDNKTSGFDVQDLRIGGMIRRTEACARRIINYVDGNIPSIEELEEDIIPYPLAEKGKPMQITSVTKIFTSNVLT